MSPEPLSKLRILVRDGHHYYTYAKVDLLDDGNGLLIFDYLSKEKVSVHADGKTFTRTAGAARHPLTTTSVPFSEIGRQIVRAVPIPSDATYRLAPYSGDVSGAFVFSSTVMNSRGSFAAEVVDNSYLAAAIDAWAHHPHYVSAQTYRPTGTGKAIILTVLNQRSTGW